MNMTWNIAPNDPPSEEVAAVPACPNCARPMRFVRAVPRLGALPELRTYECKACGVSYTEAIERADGTNDVAWIED